MPNEPNTSDNNSENKKLDQNKGKRDFHVDLIRTAAMFLVILLHSAIEPHPIVTVMDQSEVIRWWTVNIYDTIAETGVPLFVMISGALLLQPSKKEPIRVFLKKRLNRIVLPLVFANVIYFLWRYYIQNEALTLTSIIHGFETGAYYHLWFMYMILGLYLITPMLRVFVGYAKRSLLKYALVLWFIGMGIIPLLGIFDNHILTNMVFFHFEWIGYYVLGYYLLKVKIKPLYLYLSILFGMAYTLIGTYIVQFTIGGEYTYFFLEPLTANVMLIVIPIFLLLQNSLAPKIQNIRPQIKTLIHKIGQNTLPIYILHPIVLETFQNGYLGFRISVNTLTPAWEIPFLALLTLFICLAIALALKRIPILRNLLG